MSDYTVRIHLISIIRGIFNIGAQFVILLIGEGSHRHGKNRSIVRRLGSLLPLQPPLRFQLNRVVSHSIHGPFEFGGAGDGIFCLEHDEETYDNSYVLSSRLNYGNPDIVPNVRQVSLKEPLKTETSEKIEALEQQFEELRGLMNQLLLQQRPQLLQEGNIVEGEPKIIICSIPPPPPPPLPPPISAAGLLLPPTPGFSFTEQINKLQGTERMVSTPIKSESNPHQLCLGEVLKDISKVKLRPIARSPGGRPVRMRPAPDTSDPLYVLSEALKKRFSASQGTSPPRKDRDWSDESSNDSFSGANVCLDTQDLDLKSGTRQPVIIHNNSRPISIDK